MGNAEYMGVDGGHSGVGDVIEETFSGKVKRPEENDDSLKLGKTDDQKNNVGGESQLETENRSFTKGETDQDDVVTVEESSGETFTVESGKFDTADCKAAADGESEKAEEEEKGDSAIS